MLWANAQTGARYQLNDFNFTTGTLRSGDAFDMSSNFTLISGTPAVSRKVAVESEVTADIEKKIYQLEDFELKTEPMNSATGNTQPLSVSGELKLNLDKQTLALADLVVETAGLKATGSATGSQILDAPRFKGQLKSGDINPRAVMKALGKEDPDTTDSGVLKQAKFEAAFEGSPERIDFRPLSMKLDDSNMNGSLSVANFSDPAIGFNLTMDQLDLDRYLSPPDRSEKQAGAAAGSGDGKVEEGEVSVDAIKDLNLNGTLKVGKFKVRNLRFTDASLVLRARDGILAIEPLTANFYSGRINMTGRVDANGKRPAYNIQAQTSGIKVEPMLVDLNGQSKVTGTGDVNLNVTTAGTGSEQIKRGANGTVSFNLRDGEFKGVNVGQKLAQAYALYKGESFKATEPETTRFSQIKGSARINNGVLQNDDLDADSTVFDVGGAGTANFVAETINYLAKITIADTAGGEMGKKLEGLLGKTVPVRLTGNLYAPDWRLDMAGLIQGKLQEELEEEKEKAKEKLKEKLDDKLKDLFNRGDDKAEAVTPVPSTAPSTAAPSTSAPAAASEPPPPSEAEKKAAKKAAKKAQQEKILRDLIGAPKEEEAPAASEPAPAAEPAPASEPAQ